MTERIRLALFRGGTLVAACCLAGTAALCVPITTPKIPGGLATASIALIVFAAAVILILLRRRAPSRR